MWGETMSTHLVFDCISDVSPSPCVAGIGVAPRVLHDRFPVLSANGWVGELVGLLDLSSLEEVPVHQQFGG